MTIKNLEPELDKILQDHKSDLFKQEEELKENFRKQKEKLISEYEDKIRNLKNKFEKEKDEIQDNERKFYAKRLREQNEKLEDQHTEEQKKWYVNLQDEITRLEEFDSDTEVVIGMQQRRGSNFATEIVDVSKEQKITSVDEIIKLVKEK